MVIPYLERVRQLRLELFQERDLEKRQELLDRMLFLLEAQARARRQDQSESKPKGDLAARRREERVRFDL